MNKKLKTDKKDARMVREEGVAYRADDHSEAHNDYSHAGGHTSLASSRTAEFVNEIVKSIMNNMEDTAFDKLNKKINAVDTKLSIKIGALDKKIDAVDKKVDTVDAKIDAVDIKLSTKIESLDKDNKNLEKLMNTKFVSLEKLMNTKFAAMDKSVSADIKAISKENKFHRKLTLSLWTLILFAIFKSEIMALFMDLFGG